MGAITALREAGLRVPEDTSVIGGTGLRFPGEESLNLTQFCHPCDEIGEIGEALIAMALERIQKKCQDILGIYVPPTFRLRDTTRPEENLLLARS